MELKAFIIAQYATNVSPDNSLVIAGTFNSMNLSRREGMPAPAGPIQLRGFYLAAILECSISEGPRCSAISASVLRSRLAAVTVSGGSPLRRGRFGARSLSVLSSGDRA